jgi:hypothetical protein
MIETGPRGDAKGRGKAGLTVEATGEGNGGRAETDPKGWDGKSRPGDLQRRLWASGRPPGGHWSVSPGLPVGGPWGSQRDQSAQDLVWLAAPTRPVGFARSTMDSELQCGEGQDQRAFSSCVVSLSGRFCFARRAT